MKLEERMPNTMYFSSYLVEAVCSLNQKMAILHLGELQTFYKSIFAVQLNIL